MKRLLLLVVVVGVIAFLVERQLHTAATTATGPGERAAPIERARAAAQASDARTAAGEIAAKEADQNQSAAGVTENMTTDQVRRLIGPPDETSTDTLPSGATRETWVYKSVGKSVIFQNGVVVGVQ